MSLWPLQKLAPQVKPSQLHIAVELWQQQWQHYLEDQTCDHDRAGLLYLCV